MTYQEHMIHAEYQRIRQRITELHCGDNNKLVGCLLLHGIEVLSVTSDTICCATLRSGLLHEVVTIQASMPAVREYLGFCPIGSGY